VEFHTANIIGIPEIKKSNSDKYLMRTIKLYENFGQDRLAFSSKIGREDTHLNFYDEPMGMRNALVNGGEVNWDLSLAQKNWGVTLGDTPATITSMRFDYEVEDEDDEDGDYIEKEWEIPEGTFSNDQFTTEINKFPLYLEAVEIHMRHTMNPKFWKITLYLGGDQN
jgi:hypothetical protein